MLPWWVVAAAGGAFAIAGVVGLIWMRARLRAARTYASVSRETEPVDPLLHSQLAASLTSNRSRGDIVQGLRAWASGTSKLTLDAEDMRQQLRTLQTYVLDLDGRYVRREEAAWLALETVGLVFTIAGGVSAVVWATIELAK